MSPLASRTSVCLALVFAVLAVHAGAQAPLTPGQAKGSFVANGKTYTIAHAAAFIDKKDERKPVVLLLTDKPMPAEVLSGDSSLMMYRMSHPFNGVAFYLDQQRNVFRCDYYEGDFPTSTSGLLELKLDGPTGPAVAGSAHSTAAARTQTHPISLDVVFKTAVK